MLTDQTAIVTGGNSGIGRATALLLARQGASVFVGDIEQSEETEQLFAPLNIVQRSCDVRRENELAALVEQAAAPSGRIDILVNNAGVNRRSPPEEYLEEDWDAVVNTNLKGTFFLTQLVGRSMIERNYGKIIHIASLASITGIPDIPAYTAAKGGLGALTYQLAINWAKYHINVNSICPGYIRTPLTRSVEESDRGAYIVNRVPMGRWGEPEDIAGTAVFLASSASDFLTGQLIVVDGGWMAGG